MLYSLAQQTSKDYELICIDTCANARARQLTNACTPPAPPQMIRRRIIASARSSHAVYCNPIWLRLCQRVCRMPHAEVDRWFACFTAVRLRWGRGSWYTGARCIDVQSCA